MIDCLHGVLNLGIQKYQMNRFCTTLCMLLVQLCSHKEHWCNNFMPVQCSWPRECWPGYSNTQTKWKVPLHKLKNITLILIAEYNHQLTW